MKTNCKLLVEEIKIYLPTYLPTYLPISKYGYLEACQTVIIEFFDKIVANESPQLFLLKLT